MIKYFATAVIFMGAIACKKDKDPDITNNLLKSITWDNGMTAHFTYTDNHLQHIEYTFQTAKGKTVFQWNGGKLAEMYDEQSLYKNVYAYNNDGTVSTLRNRMKAGTSPNGYLFEFKYRNDKKLDSLKRYIINEAGQQLKAASGYHYYANGDLKEVITAYGDDVITHVIDGYSAAVSFDPAHYISPSLEENYPVYNYALMSQLKNRLPLKVSRVVKLGAEPAFVDKIEAHVYTISNNRIDKVVTTLSYPDMSENNKVTESVYSYY
jgi:hypothetical protein